MNNKENLIFDFDGTIADTLELLVKIYNQVAPKFGCLLVDIKDKEELKKLKAQEILKRYKIKFFKIPFLLVKIKKDFKKRIFEVEMFKKMGLVLRELKSRGFDLYILSSNSKENIEIFLENNDLLNIFTSINSSSNVFGKDRSLKKLLTENKLNKEACVYIGDETRDIEAMKKVVLPIISVTWGFNSKEALLKLNPDKIIDTPEELLEFFNRTNC